MSPAECRALCEVKLLGLLELYYWSGGDVNAHAMSYRDPDPSVLDAHLIALDGAFLLGEAFARADIEAPAVEVAFDNAAVKARIGERIALVRAEIFDRVEAAADIVEREFGAVLELNCRSAARRNRFGFADSDHFAGTYRLSFVLSMLSHRPIFLVCHPNLRW